MPRPVPATLPGIGPGPYRHPGDHPGPAEPDSRESGHPHDYILPSQLRRPASTATTSLPPIVLRGVEQAAPAFDAALIIRTSELILSRLHTIGLEIVPRERYDQLAPLFRNLGGMVFISRFVTFFLNHLVPPPVARGVVLQPTLLPGRPFYFAADSGTGGLDDPLHVVLPAVGIPAHRSPHGWLARSDGRAAHEPGMEVLAAPTAVHVSGGLDGGTWLARMWEAGRLGWPERLGWPGGGPLPFELDSRSPHLMPAMAEQLRAGAFVVMWKPVDLHLDSLSSCVSPPPRSITYCVRIRHHEADTAPEAQPHMHVTFDVPLAQLVRGVCDEVRREDEARRLEPRARAARERPVVVRQRWRE